MEIAASLGWFCNFRKLAVGFLTIWILGRQIIGIGLTVAIFANSTAMAAAKAKKPLKKTQETTQESQSFDSAKYAKPEVIEKIMGGN